jgi:hypothetical protein
MVNEPVGEIEDKRQGLLESITPYDKWKNTKGPLVTQETKTCPKCGEEIPRTWYFHKCGWEQQ